MYAVVHHPDYVAPGAPGSTYQWNKNGRVRQILSECGDAIEWHMPDPMPRAWLEAAHCPDYVAQVLSAQVPREKERRIGFAVTRLVSRRAQAVPGGTYLAARIALEQGFAANSAGGSHHALYDTGAGYCVFNDLAVAALRLTAEGVGPLLIVDCDVHQGDGTAALTAGHPAIATYSIHAEKNFPVRKCRSTMDVPLADGVEDAVYLETLRSTLEPLLDTVRPALILYQAGVDPFHGDRLGRLALTQDGLVARDELVAGLARSRHVPLASTLGGGYGADALEVAQRHALSVRTLGAAFAKSRLYLPG
ncbi:MAG: histone deacetylase [Proteobacteria bacterium SG_bin6]|nr:MAG: histone deacetylase [Proteobacteria bacterium SG_bin6]